MSFMSRRLAFRRLLTRLAAALLMLLLMASMAVGQVVADPLRPGQVMLNYYWHGAELVTSRGGEWVMFDRWSGRDDADFKPFLDDFSLPQPIIACLPPLRHHGKAPASA